MFGILEWDSPLQLLIEIAFAVVVMIGIMWLVRRVNSTSRPIGNVAPPPQGSANSPNAPDGKEAGANESERESHPA